MGRQASISDTEMAVLCALWETGPATVRTLHGNLKDRGWAYTTVQTLLQRLETKGMVNADRTGPAHVFDPTLTREELAGRRLDDLADEVFDGATSPLLLNLVNRHAFTPEEIVQFRDLLDRAEEKLS